ncbi:MAG: Hsp20/alpha crystallin family protein [Candidatus Pacebacteria bacterium]|nr:Hsp20/alpha crystallin family protein [Candidatus Paceibacterota bacterium]
MAIIKWRDPLNLVPRSFWPSFWPEEDFWPEEKEGLTVYETENEIVVKANVPGIPADKVDVSFDGGILTIKAEYEEAEEEKKKKKTVYRQARAARYYYTASIPCPVKTDKVEAEIKDGVITVTLPKAEGTKPRKIKVRQTAK